jgi:hypothetical protein
MKMTSNVKTLNYRWGPQRQDPYRHGARRQDPAAVGYGGSVTPI